MRCSLQVQPSGYGLANRQGSVGPFDSDRGGPYPAVAASRGGPYPAAAASANRGGRCGVYGFVYGDLPAAARTDDAGAGSPLAAAAPVSCGGGRGIYRLLHGDLPEAARADVPAQAVAHRSTSVTASHSSAARPEPAVQLDVANEFVPGAEFHVCYGDTFQDTCIMHVNIRGLLSHLAELSAFVRLCAAPPDIICVNETFLDVSIEEVNLEGFVVVGRRDRSYNGDERRCGGVIVFARNTIADHVTLLVTSDSAERLWFQLHTNNGPYLLCAWYRPPAQGEVQTIQSFRAELAQVRCSSIGTILIGDLNLHSLRWLVHSASNTNEGKQMQDLCKDEGLRQLVRKPTRGEYLLDLVITDIELATVEVSTMIADHAVLMVRLNLVLPESSSHRRKVWMFSKADWDGLKGDLSHSDWSFLDAGDTSEVADRMTRLVLSFAESRIPRKTITCQKKSHPWLNDRVVQLVATKHAASGTPHFAEAVQECSKGIVEEFMKYASEARKKLCEAKRGSKLWWTMSRALLLQTTKTQSIPALKTDDGTWVHDPTGKANEFAKAFRGKNELPNAVTNDYTIVQRATQQQKLVNTWSVCVVRKTLEALDVNSGTGPDMLPARILKFCGKDLAVAVLKLAERILETGKWPDGWREHWIVPIYKRKAVYKAAHYRGVHLTAQLSKVVERLFLILLMPYVSLWNCAGINQFAYTKKRGARDVLALLVLKWVRILDKGRKVAIYCSDVSGAFDRVPTTRLLAKLQAKGIHLDIIKVIGSWLDSRRASVVVGGARSEPYLIKDMVYQGTVLGPTLWNLFFEDAAEAIKEYMFDEILYADDLNAYKELPGSTANENALIAVDRVQDELHNWGKANQVEFDPSKESKHVLSRTDPFGENFKLLGIQFDCRLGMADAVRSLVGKARWKLKMLLRGKRFYSLADLMVQYKQQILSYLEYRTPAVYHATTTVLTQLDRFQDSFLRDIGVSREDALLHFNLAPLSMRRDIALLGLLHRSAIGGGPPHFREFFRRRPGSLRLVNPLEDREVSPLMRRSIWGLAGVYNKLGNALACNEVKGFQFVLQERAKAVVSKRLCVHWSSLYSPR